MKYINTLYIKNTLFIVLLIGVFISFNFVLDNIMDKQIKSRNKEYDDNIHYILQKILFEYNNSSRIYIFEFDKKIKIDDDYLVLKQRMIKEICTPETKSQNNKYNNFNTVKYEQWYIKTLFIDSLVYIDSLYYKNKYNIGNEERKSYIEQDIKALLGYVLFDDMRNVIGYIGVDFCNIRDITLSKSDREHIKNNAKEIGYILIQKNNQNYYSEQIKQCYVFIINIFLFFLFLCAILYINNINLKKKINKIETDIDNINGDGSPFIKKILRAVLDLINKTVYQKSLELKKELVKEINDNKKEIIDLKNSIEEE